MTDEENLIKPPLFPTANESEKVSQRCSSMGDKPGPIRESCETLPLCWPASGIRGAEDKRRISPSASGDREKPPVRIAPLDMFIDPAHGCEFTIEVCVSGSNHSTLATADRSTGSGDAVRSPKLRDGEDDPVSPGKNGIVRIRIS